MKNRKSMLSLGLIVLVLFLGIGYAVVNATDLTISGTASVEESNMDVEFTDAVEGSAKVTEATIGDGLHATIKVEGLSKGETVTATYTITNNDDALTALVTEKSIVVTKDAYFTVKTDLGTGKTIAPGDSIEVVVSVSLTAVPVAEADSTTDITVNLLATPQQ